MYKERNMWVFRVNRGYGGGKPSGSCPIDFDCTRVENEIEQSNNSPIDYTNCIEFLMNDLFSNGILRQGWGVPGLDLILPESQWSENYVIASHRYWSEETDCSHATGRRNILLHMLNMRTGDIIFLPNVGERCIDEGKCTVVTVKAPCQFEDRENKLLPDFGHTILIEKKRVFDYNEAQLYRGLFGAPFMHAIDPIGQHYQSYSTFVDFVSFFYDTL